MTGSLGTRQGSGCYWGGASPLVGTRDDGGLGHDGVTGLLGRRRGGRFGRPPLPRGTGPSVDTESTVGGLVDQTRRCPLTGPETGGTLPPTLPERGRTARHPRVRVRLRVTRPHDTRPRLRSPTDPSGEHCPERDPSGSSTICGDRRTICRHGERDSPGRS